MAAPGTHDAGSACTAQRRFGGAPRAHRGALPQARLFAILLRMRRGFLGGEAPLHRLGQLLLALGAALGGARRRHGGLRRLPRVFPGSLLDGELAPSGGLGGLLGGDAFRVCPLGCQRCVLHFPGTGERLLFLGHAACGLLHRGGLGGGPLALAACRVGLRLGAGFRMVGGAVLRLLA